jgi:FLVCR family feline leukemia virus subgroup C receptor-related protein
VYSCTSAIVNSLITPYKYTSTDASILGASLVISGIIGATTFSIFLDKTHMYGVALKVVCSGCLFSGIFTYWSLPNGNITYLAINMGIMGFFLIAVMPIGYSYAIELSFPVSEVMSNGLMQMISQICSTVCSLVGSKVAENGEPTNCVLIFIGLFLTGFLLSFLVKEDLRRLRETERQ